MKPTLPIHVLQSLQGHLSVAQNFIFSLNIPNKFALLLLLGINSQMFGASEDMLSVAKYTVRFLRLCSFVCIEWKVSFIILSLMSFFVLKISIARTCRFFW